MNKGESRMGTPVVGGSSLLVIFAVLCLTVFALLTLSTIQAGTRLSRHTAQSVAGYYQADSQAEEIYARLRLGEMPEGVHVENNVYSYCCPISDTQQLFVELQKNSDRWTILRWQSSSSVEWEIDESLNVWNGT